MKPSLFEQGETLLKIEEFYSKVFTTEKIILKEAKRMLTLFSSLSSETKKKLGMENYYDFISLADQFFKFYKEKNSSLAEEYNHLEEWQIERVGKFQMMKREYETYLKDRDFIPSDWIKSSENLDLSFIKNFKKLIVIDQISFSKLEIEALKKISNFCKIEIVLQCQEGDFDEENFRLKKLTLPPKDKRDISIFRTNDEIEDGINLLLEFQKENSEKNNDVYSPDPKDSMLSKLLPKYFQNSILKTLDSTELYNFLKGLYELLATSQPELKKALSLATLEKFLASKGFCGNYGVGEEDIKMFYEMLRDDFKYFNPDTLELFNFKNYRDSNLATILLNIYGDISAISNFREVDHFIGFIKNNIHIEGIIEENFIDLMDKFFEALELAKSSEELYGEKGLKYLFPDNPALGIFNLIIKYMNNIELKEIEKEDFQPAALIKPLALAKENQNRITYFIGITDAVLPGKSNNNSFFTEEQKERNGLPTLEEEKLIMKYRFFQGVFSSRKAKIFFTANENKGIKISPFLEELIISYDLQIGTPPANSEISFKIIENSLTSQRLSLSPMEDTVFLPKENSDFSDGKIGIGAYGYDNLESCFFRFYLENIISLSPISEAYERNITAKFLGTYVHNALETIARNRYLTILKNNDFSLDREYVENVLLETFRDNRFKIPLHLDIYFKEILIENIIDNILNFYLTLEKKYSDKKINRFQAEKSSNERTPIFKDKIEITLNGRVDLLIEGEEFKTIIDYKTGKKNDKQLDFYSIMMYGSEAAAEKSIFNVLSGKTDWYACEKPALTREELLATLKKFTDSQSYTLAEKKSECIYCIFENICRRELYDE